MKIASTDERLGIDRPTIGRKEEEPAAPQHKPILKHRTLSEMLTIPTPSSPILEGASGDEVESTDGDSTMKDPRPTLLQTKSDTNIAGGRAATLRSKSPPRFPVPGKSIPGQEVSRVSTPDEKKDKRHISFNTFVEQCIAVTEDHMQPPESDSDDEMLEIRSSSSSRSGRPSLSRSSSTSSEHVSIAKIAPTMLKAGSWKATNLPQMVYAPPPEYQSPQEKTSPQATSPQARKHNKWVDEDEDEEEFSSVGYDYFKGPDLGNDQQRQTSHVGGAANKAPQVGQPPSQPKWRQGSGGDQSGGSTNATANVSSSPSQPSRGILKVRPPGSSTTEEEYSPPTTSYFNYNPSPATGIGGMGGSYPYSSAQQQVQSSSPLLSPASEEMRGRSAQRQSGSSAYDRSASRGSQQSISPGTVRTPPIDTGRSGIASPKIRSPQQSSGQSAQQAQRPQQSSQASASSPVPEAEEKKESSPEADQAMDVDQPYQPERNSTPTPHSSPQVSNRPRT